MNFSVNLDNIQYAMTVLIGSDIVNIIALSLNPSHDIYGQSLIKKYGGKY